MATSFASLNIYVTSESLKTTEAYNTYCYWGQKFYTLLLNRIRPEVNKSFLREIRTFIGKIDP